MNKYTNGLGGGIYCSSSSTITNSILYGDEPDEIYVSDYDPILTFSDIQGGYPGEGNIDADPSFVDSEKDEYYLTTDSPCIDVGTSEGAPSTDIEGTPRPQGAGYDMGAYEFSLVTVYIAPGGLCDGNAPCYSKIQDGIDLDVSVFTIKTEQGIYGEDIVFDELKEIIFKGGWDSTYTSPSGETKTNSMSITDGTVIFNEGCLTIGE